MVKLKELLNENKGDLKEVKKLVDQQEAGKAQIKKVFEEALGGSKFGEAFAREAMTGEEKFSGKAFDNYKSGDEKGEATHYFIFDYGMERVRFQPIDNRLVKETASKMQMRPDLKSLSFKVKGKKAGYSFYQAMRVTVKTTLEEVDEVSQQANEQVELHRRMLTEGYINENRFLDTVKKIYATAKNKIVGLAKKLMEKIVAIAKKAKEVIQKGIKETLEMFEIDISRVKVNTEVRFKV